MPSPSSAPTRLHWVCLGPHLQGMVLSTCLPASGLRRLMAPFADVFSPSDFELRSEAARRAPLHTGLARALQAALDEQHRDAIERASQAKTDAELLDLWDAATRAGDIGGACWALVTDGRSASRLGSLIARDIEQLTNAAAETGAEQETVRLQVQFGELGRELSVLEEQLRGWVQGEGAEPSPLDPLIRGRKLLYVGGRPSANPAIRALVERHGGEYRRHEGSVIAPPNERLSDGLAWADLVVAPLDCVDRESAVALQRACRHNGLDYVPLRTASVASFAAGLCATMAMPRLPLPVNGLCLRHG